MKVDSALHKVSFRIQPYGGQEARTREEQEDGTGKGRKSAYGGMLSSLNIRWGIREGYLCFPVIPYPHIGTYSITDHQKPKARYHQGEISRNIGPKPMRIDFASQQYLPLSDVGIPAFSVCRQETLQRMARYRYRAPRQCSME